MRKFIFSVCFLAITHALIGQGMWLPTLLESLNQKEMKSMGCKIKADDLYSINKSSLKDAVCIFGGGCTAEVVSQEGLVFTNHHCGFDAIQRLSSLEKNYVDNGFWAKNRGEELPAAGTEVTFIAAIEDVTLRVLAGVDDKMSEEARKSQIDKTMAQLIKDTKREAYQKVSISPFYDGNQYFMFTTETYSDVRLVGTPPQSIGKFGSDTDNWVWPRHTGDFSVFRIYASPENKPSAYSPQNVPYKPKRSFKISLDGVREGDFTMVFGFPGRTTEYLPSMAVQQTAEVWNPARVSIRDKALKIMDGYMRADPKVKIDYVANYAGIANAWKKWLGEADGLKKYGAIEKKRAYEADFTKRIGTRQQWQTKYGGILPQFERLYADASVYFKVRDYYLETFVRNVEAPSQYEAMADWIKTYDSSGEKAAAAKIEALGIATEGFFTAFHSEVDQAVLAALTEKYMKDLQVGYGTGLIGDNIKKHGTAAKWMEQLYANSILTNKDLHAKAMALDAGGLAAAIKSDGFYQFLDAMRQMYRSEVSPKVTQLQTQINATQRLYMAAQLEVFKDKRFFPDANSTLRLTYGKVKGYRARDAVQYTAFSTLDGVMEKYVPGDYEFDVPEKLRSLYKNKDFGAYANTDGTMPLAFIGTNHTTGGNSGSPALDAHGNLIGINFDRVWEGTMSDINYDPAICRNIMVDVRYVLFVIDKYGDAGYLLKEMELVKKGRKR
jgi:Peptidase S46